MSDDSFLELLDWLEFYRDNTSEAMEPDMLF